mmetsp:Transcript_3152/g.8949  ORF Transcript_3152/g.8949 Transcript_3152/m.8949 type:complete len:184 (-) Transcript_3152:168-719(-)
MQTSLLCHSRLLHALPQAVQISGCCADATMPSVVKATPGGIPALVPFAPLAWPLIFWPLAGIYFTTARNRDLAAQGLELPPSPVPLDGYTRANWIKLEAEVGPQEAQMAGRLKDIFFRHPNPTLVRIVGRTRYTNAMKDVYNILQSPTFMMQLGHGLLEIVVFHLLPELIPLLEDIRSPEPKP